MTWPINPKKAAGISDCGKHRYWLTREWGDPNGPELLWIMLNPSMADGVHDDATMRRVMSFSEAAGFKRCRVVNLFSYRTESPDVLFKLPETQRNGPLAQSTLIEALASAGRVAAGWGADVRAVPRAAEVAALAQMLGVQLECLGVSESGAPRHPLYRNNGVPLEPWRVL